MNLQIQFSVSQIPLSYRMMIVSLIKECVRAGDEATYAHYFHAQKHLPKPYTFSVLLKNYRIQEDTISVDGLQLNVSSSDYRFLIPFLNGMQQIRHFKYKQFQMSRGAIRCLPERKVQSSRIIVKTLSPILMEDDSKKPIAPDHPDYNKHLNFIISRKNQTLGRSIPVRPIFLTPIHMKKNVIKEKNEQFTLKHGKERYLYFTAYRGKFVLEGSPDDLQLLIDEGIGLRSSQGFGHIMLEAEVK